ncbi:MAG: toxin [Desulfamplus sp.]|nr:toxin [Desulfamplus sp.]
MSMKRFCWNPEKNRRLKEERGITFEVVIHCMERGKILDIIINNTHRDRRIFIVDVADYAHMVPFSESEDEVFLHTIIPSREMTDKYLR